MKKKPRRENDEEEDGREDNGIGRRTRVMKEGKKVKKGAGKNVKMWSVCEGERD